MSDGHEKTEKGVIEKPSKGEGKGTFEKREVPSIRDTLKSPTPPPGQKRNTD